MMKVFIFLMNILFFSSFFVVNGQNIPEKTGSLVTQKEAQEALNFHNKVRADVGVKPLTWSEELAKYAQEWANHLAANKCEFEHRPTTGKWQQKYGENIFFGSNKSFNAKNASESWYAEIQYFTPGILTNENWDKSGHYSQMVWQKSTSIGIGMAICADGNVIIVANYNPSGNFLGERPY